MDTAAPRRRPPDPRRQHRRRPLPAAGVPRRSARPAVLAGARHRAGSPGGADVRRSRRHPARRSSCSEILARTLRLSRIDRPGIARVLDVADTGAGGLVVSEWIRGGSLQEVAETAPSPIGGARAIQSLAAAAEAAHQAGVALSIDHPSRVRVSIDGDVALAFPATMPDATPEDDIRGIGAALYALLVNRWPLPESGTPSGMQPADARCGRAARRATRRSTATSRSRSRPPRPARSRTAAVSAPHPTLLNLLQQATAVADRTELIEPVDAARRADSGPARGRPPGNRRGGPGPPPQRGLMIGLAWRRDRPGRADRAGVGARARSSATSAAGSTATSWASTRRLAARPAIPAVPAAS